jgi:hypothetical protein
MKLECLATYEIQPYLIYGGKVDQTKQTTSGGDPVPGGTTGPMPPIYEGEEEENPDKK